MANRDQNRAQCAWKHIESVSKEYGPNSSERKSYGSMVHSLPALIRNAGLSQALHFVKSRDKKEVTLVLQHLAEQLTRVDSTINESADKLLEVVRTAELGKYLRLTQEALACINWYKRFVQGELKVSAGDEAEGP